MVGQELHDLKTVCQFSALSRAFVGGPSIRLEKTRPLRPLTTSWLTCESTMAQSSEPSLIDYARYHGLTANYRDLDLNNHITELAGYCSAPEDDADELPDFVPPHCDFIFAEPKFRLNDGELVILASSVQTPSGPDWRAFLPDLHRTQNLKLEEPVLLTDHEHDCETFTIHPGLDLEDYAIRPDEEEETEGDLIWPVELLNAATLWDRKVRHERLQTTKEVMIHLQQSLTDGYTTVVFEQALDASIPRKKV